MCLDDGDEVFVFGKVLSSLCMFITVFGITQRIAYKYVCPPQKITSIARFCARAAIAFLAKSEHKKSSSSTYTLVYLLLYRWIALYLTRCVLDFSTRELYILFCRRRCVFFLCSILHCLFCSICIIYFVSIQYFAFFRCIRYHSILYECIFIVGELFRCWNWTFQSFVSCSKRSNSIST